MTDRLSALLGGLMTRLFVVGAVVVGMAMALGGQYHFAVGLLVPLGVVVYLLVSDAGVLR